MMFHHHHQDLSTFYSACDLLFEDSWCTQIYSSSNQTFNFPVQCVLPGGAVGRKREGRFPWGTWGTVTQVPRQPTYRKSRHPVVSMNDNSPQNPKILGQPPPVFNPVPVPNYDPIVSFSNPYYEMASTNMSQNN